MIKYCAKNYIEVSTNYDKIYIQKKKVVVINYGSSRYFDMIR